MEEKDIQYDTYHIFIATLNGRDYKIPHIMRDAEFEYIMGLVGGYMPFGLRAYHFRDLDQLLKNPIVEAMPVCDIPIERLFDSPSVTGMKLKDKAREHTYPLNRRYDNYALYETELGNRFCRVDGENISFIADFEVYPIHLNQAREYIAKYHRHCGPPKFHKFSVALYVKGEEEPVGVAVASTPKARHQMDGTTLEINRVCVNPLYSNACSKLYAQVIRIGRAMGYRRFITYTLPEESDSSVKAVGFRFDGMTEDTNGWDSPSRRRHTEKYPAGAKKRWVLIVE